MNPAVCPVCSTAGCRDWENRRSETWHGPKGWRPQPSVPPGELLPCGSSPDGTHREFFANPADVEDLIRNGITLNDGNRKTRYRVGLSPTPFYANGDVQVIARLEAV